MSRGDESIERDAQRRDDNRRFFERSYDENRKNDDESRAVRDSDYERRMRDLEDYFRRRSGGSASRD